MIKLLILFCIISLIGCSSSPVVNDYDLDAGFRYKHYDYVINKMELKLKTSEKKDQLLAMLDLAVVYHVSGKYSESNKLLMAAKNKIIWEKYMSFSEESKSFLLGDDSEKFRVEDHEQILLQTYIVLNFISLGNWNAALVEVRSLHQSMQKMENEKSMVNYKNHFFISYLSGLIFEKNNKYDEAYIDYKRVHEINPKFSYIGYDLFRMAWLTENYKDAENIVSKFKISKEYQNYIKNFNHKQGELILVFHNGSGPRKVPHKYNSGIVMAQARVNGVDSAEIEIDDEKYGKTIDLFDIESFALNLYEKKYGQYFKRDIARAFVKEAIALPLDLVSGGFVGSVTTRVLLHSTDDIDLRSWEYLPQNIQIMKVKMNSGLHKIRIEYNASSGDFEEFEVRLNKGETKVVPIQFARTR